MDARRFLYWLNRLVPTGKRKAKLLDSLTVIRLMVEVEKLRKAA